MGRGLPPLVSWIAASLLLLVLVPAAGMTAPFTSYQFRPLPGEAGSSRPPAKPGADAPGRSYPGVGPSPNQPRYRFRDSSQGRIPRYSMPGYRSQPDPEVDGMAAPSRNPSPATAQPVPGYRFRPGGERGSNNRNR